VGSAFRKGARAAFENIWAIVALQVAMGGVAAIYFFWPPGSAVLAKYAVWQQAGGAFGNGLAAALAGGVLSEASLIYFQDRGRWSARHVENICFKVVLFFFAGSVVYEFYRLQAIWWGHGASLSVLVPKVLVDQLGYTVFLATPYYALATRWQTLRYSLARLWSELDAEFLTERMLPVLVMNWLFWVPAMTLLYAMPSLLQPPLYVFATAMWGLLVPAVSRQNDARSPAAEGLELVPMDT
jgi:hypothetical protein